jgi:group I intron endonuclease
MGYIYLITNTINKKQYVGQTKRPDVEERWRQHRSNRTIGMYIHNAYQKYGIENFKFQIICICFDEDCDKYEEEYIKKFNTLSPNGYNLKGGGHFSKHHPDTMVKMRESLKKVWTEEKRKEMSERFKGENGPCYGKKLSDEQKEKLKNIRKEYWKNISKEEYERICNERKSRIHGNNPSQKVLDALEKGRQMGGKFSKKCVGKYDENDTLLETYSSIAEAATKNGICRMSISKSCSGNKSYKKVRGFVWKFI